MKPILSSAFITCITCLGAGPFVMTAHAQLPYGPDTCDRGYVWREAFPGDHVCVTPRMRDQAVADNAQAAARREPGGGAYGPDTCRQGYVWREARPGDHVCVIPETRAQTASDNRQAGNRFARNTQDVAPEEHIFIKPRWDEQRLDWCTRWGIDCGQKAADYYCRHWRYTGAVDFDADVNIGRSAPTRTSIGEEVCDQPFCTGFKYITCQGKIPQERIFVNPVWMDKRLDACVTWSTDCGKPTADAFCRSKGFTESFHFQLDREPGYAPTRLIGSNQVCDQNFCRGFQVIICQ